MTTLSFDFQFSQGRLQDYVDCPRRFQLYHLDRLAWPAMEVEPALENERHVRQGVAFHRLIHQHLLGIASDRLSSLVAGDDLSRWWQNYLTELPRDLPPQRHPELILSTPVAGHRLLAKLDLVAVHPQHRAIIVDWKTTRSRPQRRWLAARLQTRVYSYLLVRAGSQLNDGHPLGPEQVEMIYWFANFPSDPERLAYDDAQYEADEVYLSSLIEEIIELGKNDFPLTTNRGRCRYCQYRSLCQRGVRAGPFAETEEDAQLDEDFDLSFDFEQVAEIAY